MKAIQTSAIAAAIGLCTSSPLLAQTDRVYITGVGGFARSTDTTSGEAMAEVGVRIAPHLLVFGDVGRFENLQPSDVQPSIASTTSQLSSSQGLAVIGTGSVPAWYSVGGLRFEVPLQGRVQPYVFGGAGFARLMPTAQFTLSSGTLPDGTPPRPAVMSPTSWKRPANSRRPSRRRPSCTHWAAGPRSLWRGTGRWTQATVIRGSAQIRQPRFRERHSESVTGSRPPFVVGRSDLQVCR